MKISIITPASQNDKLLDLTIDSVKHQGYTNIEHIIGYYQSAENDAYINSKYYSENLVKVIPVQKSFYDALIKSATKAKGEIICILNPGETFYNDDILSQVVEIFEPANENILYGKSMLFEGSSNSNSMLFDRAANKKQSELPFGKVPLHTAIFIKKEWLKKSGMLTGKLKFTSDYEFYLKLFMQAGTSAYVIDTYLINPCFYKHNIKQSTETSKVKTEKPVKFSFKNLMAEG